MLGCLQKKIYIQNTIQSSVDNLKTEKLMREDMHFKIKLEICAIKRVKMYTNHSV